MQAITPDQGPARNIKPRKSTTLVTPAMTMLQTERSRFSGNGGGPRLGIGGTITRGSCLGSPILRIAQIPDQRDWELPPPHVPLQAAAALLRGRAGRNPASNCLHTCRQIDRPSLDPSCGRIA